jgi:hypothetical protein
VTLSPGGSDEVREKLIRAGIDPERAARAVYELNRPGGTTVMEKLFNQYKFLAQIAAFVAAGLTGVITGGIHGVVEWGIVITTLANAANVYLTPELSEGMAKYAKGLTGVVLAIAGGLAPALVAGGLDTHEVWMLVELGVGVLLGFAPQNYRYAVKRGLVRE